MKLWIDDMRDAPDDTWTVVRKVQPAINFLAQFYYQITEVSIDHDIENRPDDETFLPVAHFLGMKYTVAFERAMTQAKVDGGARMHLPKIRVHSDNPVGARAIVNLLSDYGIQTWWEPYTTQADFAARYGL